MTKQASLGPTPCSERLDYASPEQLRDAAKADVRSDLYSLGCTLYFALSGGAPFEGGDVINKIYKQRMEDPPPLENRARGVPAAFAAVVRKLMSKNPEERYQNSAELRADLARWTDPDRVHAILGSEAEAARSFPPPSTRRARRRRPPSPRRRFGRVSVTISRSASSAQALNRPSHLVTSRQHHPSPQSYAIAIPEMHPPQGFTPLTATLAGSSSSPSSQPPRASLPSL